MAWLTTFLQSNTGLAVQGLLVGAFLVFVLGAFAALRDGTFDIKYIDSFVRSTIWGRVAPIFTVCVVGYLANNDLVTTAGIAAAALVAAGMIGTALESIKQLTMPKPESATVNAVPDE